jgi:hypothetical protein
VISERNGVTILLINPSKVSKSLSVIMITLMLGPNSSCIKLLIWITLGSSVLIGNILEESFPYGFARWWSHFGLILDVLPLGLIESFELLKTCFKTDSYGSKFPHILHFVKQFRLPWILRWQYVIVEDKFECHWYVKWWDKFSIDPIIKKVKLMVQAQNLPLPSIVSPKLITPDNIGKTPNKVTPYKDSPVASSSSKKQSFKSKKKKALLQAMALLDSLSASDGDDDNDDMCSEASSVAAYDP